MQSNALPLIEEFLRSGVPQQRKNALTALTVVGDEESARMIARTAILDADAGVRARALEEVARVDGEVLRVAVSVFRQQMESGSKVEQERAYASLGYLHSQGKDVPPLKLPFSHLFRLAASLNKHLYPSKSLEYRLRAWKPAVLGSAAGTIVLFSMTFGLRSAFARDSAAIVYLIGIILTVVAGAVMAVSATQRTSPSSNHVNYSAAISVEVLVASFMGFLGIIAFYAIISALMKDIGLEKNVETIAIILLCGVLAGVTRAVTVVTFGVYRKRVFNRLTQVLAGTSAGFWVATLSILAFKMNDPNFYWEKALLGIVGSIPLAAGCACAYAFIDNACPPPSGRKGLMGKALRMFLVPVLLLADILLLLFAPLLAQRI